MNTTQLIKARNQYKTDSYVLAYGSQAANLVHTADQEVISVKWNMGQLQRRAAYALCYGASIRTAVKASGLSIRRVKVIAKQLTREES